MYLKVNVAGTSTSHQDKLTGTEHTLLPEATNKKEQNIWNNSYQNIGHQATNDSDPWKMGNKGGEPYAYDCSSLLHGKNFYTMAQGEETQS